MSWRSLAVLGGLVALATALSLLAQGAPKPSNLPSIHATGPGGLRALYLYLKETKRPGKVLSKSLTELPKDARTIVVAAPTRREISKDEVAALQRFTADGGTLVYLAPGMDQRQPAMTKWLHLDHGDLFHSSSVRDAATATADVWLPRGPLTGLKHLAFEIHPGVKVDEAKAVPVAGQGPKAVALWRLPTGKGEIWIGAGVDLAENARIAKDGNLTFWDRLARRGALYFDEFHQTVPPDKPLSPALVTFFLQLLVVGVFFVWVKGSRLGPPRPEQVVRHRESREYLTAFAHLTRQAQVETDLAREIHGRLRRALSERFGIAPDASDEEAARIAAERLELPARRLRRLLDTLAHPKETLTPRRFTALARAAAELEASLRGRKGA